MVLPWFLGEEQDSGFKIQGGALVVLPWFLGEEQDSGFRIQASALVVFPES